MILNHLWPARLPGGYVGVDVFFVISGFLITTHLIGEVRRSGRIRFARFYARRAQRLLPAALLVSVVSLIGAVLVLPVARWRDIAEETFAATAYLENWFLAAKAVDYSAQDAAATTAQHYWSLSVEEQFYLFWPLLLMALVLFVARGRHRRGVTRRGAGAAGASSLGARLLPGIVLIAALSFGFALWLTASNRSEAYFNTLTRVWEFMVGALVAVAVPWLLRRFADRAASPVSLLFAGLGQWLGLAMIAVSALTFDAQTPFPGPWALLPVTGTALVILSGPQAPPWSPVAWLSVRPVQLAGDLSYSLYLWHWPLIVLAPGLLGRDLRFLDRLAILAVTVLLAWLTKRFVEDPGRSRLFRGKPSRVPLLATLASVLVMGLLAGSVVFAAGAVQQRDADAAATLVAEPCFGAGSLAPGADCADPFGPAQIPAQGEHETPWFAPEGCALATDRQILAAGKPSVVDCDFTAAASDPEDATEVWLFGDSHAEHWKGALYDVAAERGWRVQASLQGGCPIVDLPRVAFKGTPDQNADKAQACRSWSAEVTQRIADEAPDLVILSTFASAETVDDGSGRDQIAQYRGPSQERLRAWADAGSRVVVLRDIPVSQGELSASCVAQHPDDPEVCSSPRSTALPSDPVAEAAAALEHPNVSVVDLSDRFCTAERCFAVIGGVPVYYDSDHMSRSYSLSLSDALAEALPRVS